MSNAQYLPGSQVAVASHQLVIVLPSICLRIFIIIISSSSSIVIIVIIVIIIIIPLLVLKGIYHYWEYLYFFQGS